MLKKIISLFCLTTIFMLTHCMNESILDELTELLNPLYRPNDDTEANVIVNLCEFDKNHKGYIYDHTPYVLKMIFAAEALADRTFKDLLSCVKIIIDLHVSEEKKGSIKLKTYIKAAFKAQNIERLKEYTKFDNYVYEVNNDLRLYFELCKEDLEKLGLEEDKAYNYLDFICLKSNINYFISDEQTWLGQLILSNDNGNYVETIVAFIENASVEELNKQDEYGRTPLIIALDQHNKHEDNNNDRAQHYTQIIIKLIEHGANPDIRDKRGLCARDIHNLNHFEDQAVKPRTYRAYQIPRLSTNSKKNSSINPKIVSIAALSAVGIFVLGYIGYKYCYQKTTKVTLRLK